MLLLTLPAPASAHGLVGRVDSPLPLVVYLAGAAIAVALSFGVAFTSHKRWRPTPTGPGRRLPQALLVALRVAGLLAWGWVVVQFVIGGSSAAEVGSLFTWVYGWVGLAIVSALLAPVWDWLDPFSTLHDIGAWAVRRLPIRGWEPAPYPRRLSAWPAVVAFSFFVWLELGLRGGDMGAVVVGYTIVTLAGMAHFGKDAWRRHGEVFSVWFGLLGRLARYASDGPHGQGLVRRQRFPDGLLGRPWDASLVALVAIATAAILFDGLSQTQLYFDLFGLPGVGMTSVHVAAFLAIVTGGALWVGQRVGMVAMGAGLLPISVGYLIAHYLTFLLGDGQRIVIAISDPFQLGWDLFDTAFFEPTLGWLPPSLLWTIMFTSVVGGHVLGAWAGHLGTERGPAYRGDVARAQLPLATIMVVLTTLTLWSLGQNVISEEVGEPQTSRSALGAIVGR